VMEDQFHTISIAIGPPSKDKGLHVDQLPRVDHHRKESGGFHSWAKKAMSGFIDKYLDIVTNPLVGLALCALWIAFIAFSIIYITRFEVNLTTRKLFIKGSPLIEIDELREREIIPTYTSLTTFVMNPNLSDPNSFREFNALVHSLETLPQSWGPQSSNLWLRAFAEFEQSEDELHASIEGRNASVAPLEPTSLSLTGEKIAEFLESPMYSYWRGFLRLDNESRLESFFFTTAYHGSELRDWYNRTRLLKKWRERIDAYPQFKASVFNDDAIFYDLLDNMPSDMWQSATATLGCMALVCLVLMQNFTTVAVVSVVIASVITGMLGILSYFSFTMDPVLMAALVISIGFSVDIPAHIAYHYHSAGFSHHNGDSAPLDVKQRLKITLASVGFPALQASLSTSLCVLSLLFVPIYMSTIFVTIMLVTIMLCVVHSLVLIPTVFSLGERVSTCLRRDKVASTSANSQPN